MERTAEQHSADHSAAWRFHLALLGVFTTLLSVGISWLAFATLPPGTSAAPRARLRILAILDSVLFVCMVIVGAHAIYGSAPVPTAAAPASRIGVMLSEAPSAKGLGIARVDPGWPAAQAGLLPGDRIIKLDGEFTHTNEAFKSDIAAHGDAMRHLHVQRGAQLFEVDLRPAFNVVVQQALFEADATSSYDWSFAHALGQAKGVLVVLALLGVVGAVAKRRAVSLSTWKTVVTSVAALMLVSAFGDGALRLFFGSSIGSRLCVMMAASLSMLAIALASKTPRAPLAASTLSSLQAFLRGLFYLLTCLVRVGVVLMVVSMLPLLRVHPASEVFGVSAAWPKSAYALFFFAGAVVAPIAEEYVFRGRLLPWLCTWLKPELAIGVSAVIFGAGHIYYGSGALVQILCGVVLGWMRVRTGKLHAGIALHMLVNAVAMNAIARNV